MDHQIYYINKLSDRLGKIDQINIVEKRDQSTPVIDDNNLNVRNI